MWDCSACQIDNVHLLAGALRGLTHCIWHSICFSNTHGNGAAFITDNHSHAKLEATTAFYHFCNTGNLDNSFFELILCLKILLFCLLEFCHIYLQISLKFQAAFTRTICESFDASNIAVATAIKNDGLNVLILSTLSNSLTNQL